MKKAEISVSMIVGIVIIVITFGIVALVYSQLITPIDMDREVCKQSAVFRGTLPEGAIAGQTKDLISLKCKTKRICVTTKNVFQGKGECSHLLGEDFSTYRIKNKTADQQIKTLLAREMADCWDMLGRGNIAIFARDMKSKTSIGAVAVICSRIHFDETITGTGEGQLGIKEIQGFNRYLLSHKVPNHEVSYWDFFRNTYDGETMAILSGNTVAGSDFLNDKMNITDTKTIVFIEVRPTIAGALMGSAITGTVGALVGAKVGGVAGFMGGGLTGAKFGFDFGDWAHLKLLENEGLFPDGTNAAGIFLTDYNMKGFKEIVPTLKRDNTGAPWYKQIWEAILPSSEPTFEIASYA
jgi:hypothetical protein